MASPLSSNPQAKPTVSKDEVGWLFVQEYYTILNKHPSRLHLFYTKPSTLVHGNEGESIKPCVGQIEIHKKIMDQEYHDCKVLVSNVDSQSSAGGGIVIQVLGEIANNNGPSQKFAQTFFLAEQKPTGYFVLNDIFRYLKEDVDVDDERPATESVNPSYESVDHTAAFDFNRAAETRKARYTEANGVKEDSKSEIPVAVAKETVEAAPPAAAAAAPATTATADVDATRKAFETASTPGSESAPHLATVTTEESIPETPKQPFSWASMASKATAAAPSSATSQTVHRQPQAKTSRPTTGSGHENGKAESERSSHRSTDKPPFSIFIKNVGPKVTEEQLKEVLRGFGRFTNLDINRQKNCGFADYSDESGFHAAIQANTVAIGSDNIIIEERRRGAGRGQGRNASQSQGMRKQNGRDQTREEGSQQRGRGRGGALRGRNEQAKEQK